MDKAKQLGVLILDKEDWLTAPECGPGESCITLGFGHGEGSGSLPNRLCFSYTGRNYLCNYYNYEGHGAGTGDGWVNNEGAE